MDAIETRRLTASDLIGLSHWQLTLLRNAPYARHGYRFHDARLQAFFGLQPWYKPVSRDENRTYSRMNTLERQNISTIVNFEGGQQSSDAAALAYPEVALLRDAPAVVTPAIQMLPAGSPRGWPPPCVCIDPGHSRATVGARGADSAEYQVCWQVAVRLRSILKADGVTVVMTKQNEDQSVRNRDRAAIANRAGASLFIRLHGDAAHDSGCSVYYPAQQGVHDGVRGPSEQVIAESRRAAVTLHSVLIRRLKPYLRDRGLHSDSATYVGSRQGALTGSIFSRVPIVLVEMVVITNPHDEDFIDSDIGQSIMAHSLAAAICKTVGARTAVRAAPGHAHAR